MKTINTDKINKYIETLQKSGVDEALIASKLNNVSKFMLWASSKGKIAKSKSEQIMTLIANRISDFESKKTHPDYHQDPKQDQFTHNVIHNAPKIDQFDKATYHGEKSTDGLSGELNIKFRVEMYKIKSIIRGILRNIPLLGSKTDLNSGSNNTSVNLQTRHYIGFGITMLLLSFLSIGAYNQFFKSESKPQAFPTTLTRGSRTLSFQGRLTDSLGNPIITSTNVVFKLHTAASGGSQLYTSGTCAITPDQDGILSTVIGEDCGAEIDSATFSENAEVFLGITVGSDSEMTPRQQIANVGYAINSETLQGFPPDTLKNSIPYIDNQGDIKIAATTPSVVSNYASQTFLLGSAGAITVQSAGSGDVTLTATESGTIKFLTAGTQAGVVTGGQLWGLGTTGPDAKLDSLATSGQQLRLTYTDGSVYTGFTTNSGGDLTIAATGGDLAFTDNSNTLFQIKDQGVYPFVNLAGKTDTGDPATCAEGDIYYNDTDDTIKICHESNTWEGLDGGGSLVWTDSGTTSYLTDTTDEVVIGASSPLSSAKFSIDGDTDQIQMIVQGNATQTTSLAVFENSAGADQFTISNTGDIVNAGNTTLGDAIGDTVTANAGAWTYANDTTVALSGGLNGLNFDSNTLSIDATNDRVGFGTAGPDARIDSLSASGEQLRLTYADGSTYTSFTTNVSGDLTITPSGTDTYFTDNATVYGNTTLGNAGTDVVAVTGKETITFDTASTNQTGLAIGASQNTATAGTLKGLSVDANFWATSGTQTGVNGLDFIVQSSGNGGTVTTMKGITAWGVVGTGSTVNDFKLIDVANPTNNGAITTLSGLTVANLTSGTNNTLILAGTSTSPSGNWGIYNTSSYSNYLAGTTGIGTTGADAKLDVLSTTEQLRLTYADGTAYSSFTTDSSGNLTINTTGNQITIETADYLNLSDSDNLVFAGTTSLAESTSATDSGAYFVGVFDEFDNSASVRVQDVLDDLDAAISSGGSNALWTDSGTTIYLTDTTDEMVLGGSSPLSSAKLSIDGDDDQIQMLVQGNATQTSNLALFEDSAGTDLLSISGAGVLSVPYLVDISNTAYGLDPAGTSNFGGYSQKITGGALLAYDTGSVGIGTTGPDAKLDVASTTEQLRLSYTDGAVYSAHTVDSSGNLTIDNTGTKTVIADDLQITGNDILDSSATSRVTLGATTTLTNTALTLSGTATLTASSLTAFNCSDCIDFDDLEDTLDVDAAVVLNQGSNTWTQNFTGTTTTGMTYNADSLTTGIGQLFSLDGLTSGIGLSLTSTSTALTSGSLANLDWSPGSSTTATGDLFKINIGANGNVGNLLNVTDNTSSLFRVAENQIESSIPHSFSAPGDVSIAYDLLFSNQTASYIKSSAPLYIEAGESFESNDLSLKTYNSGDLVLDLAGGATFAQAQAWDLANTSTTSLNIESGLLNLDTTNSRVAIGSTAPNEALDVEGEIEFDIDTTNDTTIGVCKDAADGSTDVEFRECNGAASDIAEYYLAESNLRPGDVVVLGNNNGTMITKKSTLPYQETAFGVVSTYPVGQFGKPLGYDLYKNQTASAIGLNGRVPVKVSLENGPIAIGDPLTTSSTAGVAMKATKSGTIIGRALENYDGTTKVSNGTRQQEEQRENSMMKFNTNPVDPTEEGVGKILVFNNITSYSPETAVYAGITNDQPTQSTITDIIASIPQLTTNTIRASLLTASNLFADTINAGNATIDSIIAKTITSDKIIAKNITTDTIETKNANISGELIAKDINATDKITAKRIESENIASLEAGMVNNQNLDTDQEHIIATLNQTLKKVAQEGESNNENLSVQVNDIQQTLAAIESEPLPNPEYYQNLDDVSVGSLTVSTDANIYNLFVTNIASLGDITIQDNTISNSMGSLNLTALTEINLMDGAVVIARDGTITTKGELIAQGGIKTNKIKSLDKTDVSVVLENNIDPSKINEFQIKDENGQVVSGIDQKGKGKFTELSLDTLDTATDSGTIIASSQNLIDNGINAPAVITNQAVSGTSTMPAGAIDLIVYNQKITDKSLIYITPTTPTQNNNIYIAYKEPCSQTNPPTGGCKQFFKVSIDSRLTTDVKFNWLIIN